MDESESAELENTLMDRVYEMMEQDKQFCVKNCIHFSHLVFMHMRCAIETAHNLGMTKGHLVECMDQFLNWPGSKYKGKIKVSTK